jgi:hypothetical protein
VAQSDAEVGILIRGEITGMLNELVYFVPWQGTILIAAQVKEQ